jgi:beta-glucosidase
MTKAAYHFPAGFLWGTATAAHQVEGGNNNNNWAAWEAQPGRIMNGDRSGLACDWWGGRWKEDLDRAAEGGQNAHRFSVEWSRIQPTPDHWDEQALEMYRQMLRGMVERGLTPMVTLHHFSDPLWLCERGSWENDETPALFAVFVRKVVEALKEYVNLWVTINEPNVFANEGWLNGNFPPGKKDMNLVFRVTCNLLRAHSMAYRVIHEVQKEARVGTSIHNRGFVPARPGFPPDRWMASLLSRAFNESFVNTLKTGRFNLINKGISLPEAVGTQDFVGVNYYTTELVEFSPLAFGNVFSKRYFPKDALLSSTGFIANAPAGMFTLLKWANTFNLPIIVTENGVEDTDDSLRPRYILEHIHQVWRAVNFNFPIKGYFHWSLVDNFEWERGWTQRFGLWGLNTETQLRIRHSSVDLYAAICRENGITSDMVEKFAPQAMGKLFPV